MSYATRDHLALWGLPAAALSAVPTATQDAALEGASATADSYFGRVFDVPLASWGDDVRRAVVQIAVYDLLAIRAFAPGGEATLYRKRYEDALAWLERVANGQLIPSGLAGADGADVVISSDSARGW